LLKADEKEFEQMSLSKKTEDLNFGFFLANSYL
jgi:hypothetical protein